MEYSIPEINDGLAKIVFPDNSWTFIPLTEDMTAEDLDDLVYRMTPPHLLSGTAPSFLSAGATRTAAEKPAEEYVDSRPEYIQNRTAAYGTLESQIEFITENGMDAWVAKVNQIKADNPKT